MQRPTLLLLALGTLLAGRLPAQISIGNTPAAWAFPAGQSPVYQLRTLRVESGARAVEILFQHIKVKTCRDILSGETLPPRQGRLAVTIPAGVFRIIDLELE